MITYMRLTLEIHDDHFTWGDGDSLDRERVRDILVYEVWL